MNAGGGPFDSIGRSIPLPLPVPDWSKPIILALLLLSAGFAVRAHASSRRARRLERTQRALAADLDAMQLALVPELPPRLGELEISAAYRPADGPAAGGDFYDAFALPGGRVAIVLGDVSGHGRAALAHAARMRFTVRAYAEAGLAPRLALKLAGGVLGRGEGDLFTTVVLAIYDPDTASLTYATAGHPYPLTLGGAAHEPVTSCSSPPLGWGAPTGHRQTTVPFPHGARACFFSDGLVEARAGEDLLGRRRLAAMFAQLGPHQPARALLLRVWDTAEQIRDDMAACIIESAGGPARAVREHRLEEIEVDAQPQTLEAARRFLQSCAVATPQIAHVIARARAITSDRGLAVIAVRLDGRSRTATASAAPAPTPALLPEAGRPAVDRRAPRAPAKPGSARPASLTRT